MGKTIYSGAHLSVVGVLLAARKQSGLTQTELGARLGRDQTFISNIETRQRQVSLLEFIAIARALGRDPTRLFKEIEQEVPDHLEI